MNRIGKLKRARLLVLVTVLFCVLFGSFSATASATEPKNLGEIIKFFFAKQAEDPKFTNFSTYSAADKLELEKAMGALEWFDTNYAGRAAGDFASHYGLTGLDMPAKATIADYVTALDDGTAAIPDFGPTTLLAGGETADAAAGTLGFAGIADALAVVPTVALGAAAFSAGWAIGGGAREVIMEAWSTPEELSATEPTFSLGLATGEQQWMRVKEDGTVGIGGFMCSTWGSAFREAEFHNCGTEKMNGKIVTSGPPYEAGPLGGAEKTHLELGETRYVLTFRQDELEGLTGQVYWDAAGYELNTLESKNWHFGEPTTEEAEKGCETIPFTPNPRIAGWPPNLEKMKLELGVPQVNECTPYKENFLGEREYAEPNRITGRVAVVTRDPSEMPVKFPHAGRPCPTGHTCPSITPAELPAIGDVKKQAEEKLPGTTKNPHHHAEETICHYIKCTSSPEPLPGTLTVPSCTGLTGEACLSKLLEAGFTNVELDPLDWKTAVLTKPALAEIETSPAEGAVVETTTKIKVIANPSEEDMPVFIPIHLPGGEPLEHYKKRIEEEGWTNNEPYTLPDPSIDTSVGPGDVSRTSPDDKTREDPSKKSATKVIIVTNPDTAPPAEPGKSIGPPSEPGIKFPNFGVLCKGFPFGVPCWLAKTIEGWSSTPKAPVWHLELSIKGKEINFTFDLAKLEAIMIKVRIALVILSTIGLVLLFYNFAKGGSPPSGSGTGDGNPMGYGEPGGPGAEQEFN